MIIDIFSLYYVVYSVAKVTGNEGRRDTMRQLPLTRIALLLTFPANFDQSAPMPRHQEVHHRYRSWIIYAYIYLESPLPFVFGVVCKTPLFWVRLILFGAVSCKKSLLSSKQVLAIYTKHYWAKSCERFVLVLCDVGSGTLTHHSDPRAELKLDFRPALDPQFVSKYKTFACFL